jgi:SWI/SNF-related matrix-associated actin-dependent regulator 1 of chromatin subfamily A
MVELTEEQIKQMEANRVAALTKRKAFLESNSQQPQRNPWNLFKCQKIDQPQPFQPKPEPEPNFKFLARLEICSHDSFAISPLPVPNFHFPTFDTCFSILNNILSRVSYLKFKFQILNLTDAYAIFHFSFEFN